MSRRSEDRRLTTVIREVSVDLVAYLRRRVGPDDAADLFSETMLVAWRRVGDLPADPERARMWLFGIARGTLLNHARGEQRRRALGERLRAYLQQEDTTAGPDAGLEVRDALNRLDPDSAELIRLVHWERMTLAEAAELLTIPASTARSRYMRARETLRVQLGSTVN